MGIDGRLLARARDALAARRQDNERETDRRRELVYNKIPRIRELDRELRLLMPGVFAAALTKNGAGERVREIETQSLELQAQKARLLAEGGFAADFLEPVHSCADCNDSGYVRGKACSCLMRLYETELTLELSDLFSLGNESFESFRLGYYSDERDPETGVSAREYMELVYSICVDYAEHFGPKSGNLLFQGGTGLGKTFLSACIARVVAGRGFSVVYDTAVSVLAAFEDEKFSRGEDAPERVRRLLECDLLILDDLGTELGGSMTHSALYTLINSRLVSRKKTLISTNLPDEELRRRYTPQICSRLEGEYQKLSFYGKDIRLIRNEES